MAVPVNESLPVPTAQVLTGRRASVLVQMLAIVSLLLLAATCRCSSASVVYVSPECPRSGSAAANTDEQQSPCEELSSALDGLESNTTLILLPGKHYLNRSWTVSDKTDLVIRGNESSHSFSECCGAPPQVVASAEVTCTSDLNSSLAFYNVDGLTIENIAFSKCGAENNVEGLSLKFKAAALFLYNVRNAVLSGVTVQESYGYGLIGFNVYGKSLITASTFFRNNYDNRYISCGGNVLFYYTRRPSHYSFNNALRIDSSTFASSWSDCSVSGAGVNIILDQSLYEVDVTITNVTSCSNKAIDGANFYLEVGSTVAKSSITMEKVRSIYGSAVYFGGGLLYRYKGFGFIDAPTADIEVPLTIVDSEFSENTALYFGAGIYLDVLQENYQRIALENCSIHNNTGGDGIGVYAYFGGFSGARLQMKNVSLDSNNLKASFSNTYSVVSLNYVRNASFQDCSFTHNEASGLYMLNSNATMSGEITFFNNTAEKGGGAFLDESSLFLLNPSHINFTQNNANTRGGALFVNKPSSGCFLQIVDPDSPDISVSFHNNTAGEAGSVLYGGNLYPMPGVELCSLNETFDTSKFFKFTALQNVTSSISSDPFAVYSCLSSETLESEFIVKKAFPGQTIEVPVVTVGQENGSVPASVKATINGRVIGAGQKMSGKTCANLGYTNLVSENITSPVTVNLTLGLSDYVTNSVSLNVMVTIYPCPIGFQMEAFSCECDAQFRTTTVTCSIEYENITHSESFWFGPVNDGTEMAFFDPCPFDYCVSGERSIPVDDLDQQCSNNRSGTLCGQCRENYSLVLGSSRCMECSYNNISLVLAFAVLGVVLVLLLALCNLTVAKGTINGLIFFANIVQFNHTVFFPSPVEGYTYFLSVFIAWINLDFGIETCFFDGMNALWSVGLQLIFPLYLILLMGMVQLLARVSSPLSKVVGYFNGTAVFATLFLLSYAKTVRTVITTIAVVRLHNSWVWLYDGGVSVTNWEWIVLAMIMMAVFFFLLIPYTLMLVFIQVLQRMSHLRFLRLLMMKYLKPWCDVYLNHYKKEFYFWTGLLLIMRFVLFIVSSFSPKPVDGLLATVIVSALLLAIAWFRGGVYNKWWLNALECFFLLNLCLLSATSLYVRVTTGDSGSDSHNGMKNATVGTSVTLAFVCFLIIFSWHCFQLAKKSKKVQNTVARVQRIFTKKADDIKKEEEVEVKGYEHEERSASITTMIVELREPMLDDC